MSRTAKFLLALSLMLLVASFTKPGSDFAWGCLKPMGAIVFIAFYLVQLLGKEVAAYDQEQKGSGSGK